MDNLNEFELNFYRIKTKKIVANFAHILYDNIELYCESMKENHLINLNCTIHVMKEKNSEDLGIGEDPEM